MPLKCYTSKSEHCDQIPEGHLYDFAYMATITLHRDASNLYMETGSMTIKPLSNSNSQLTIKVSSGECTGIPLQDL